MFDTTKIRRDFPQLERAINDKPIIYLDSTATSLKPRQVLAKMNDYYTQYTANVFRGIYTTSEEATAEFERSRELVSKFIGARDSKEIIFTRNTSESINVVASSWAADHVHSGDAIVTTIMEHHSNFVPWQQLALKKGLELRVWGLDEDGRLDLKQLDKLVTRKTKLLAITATSNVLGTINPITEIVRTVKRLNPACLVLVDAAQAAAHMPIDVKAWGADFVAFSGHKMLGPTGVGVLWGRYELLDSMRPYQYGGEMISEVHVEKTLFKDPPHKFEAGTPDIGGVIGLGAAVSYLSKLGMKYVRAHEVEILSYAASKLKTIPGLAIIGPTSAKNRGGVIAFTLASVHPHDIAQLLDEDNVCIRAGNHCAMPLHESLHLPATARASFYVYTTTHDIDMLVAGLKKIRKMFS